MLKIEYQTYVQTSLIIQTFFIFCISSIIMPKKATGGNKRNQFFASIKSEKLDTLRWSLSYGGFNPITTGIF